MAEGATATLASGIKDKTARDLVKIVEDESEVQAALAGAKKEGLEKGEAKIIEMYDGKAKTGPDVEKTFQKLAGAYFTAIGMNVKGGEKTAAYLLEHAAGGRNGQLYRQIQAAIERGETKAEMASLLNQAYQRFIQDPKLRSAYAMMAQLPGDVRIEVGKASGGYLGIPGKYVPLAENAERVFVGLQAKKQAAENLRLSMN